MCSIFYPGEIFLENASCYRVIALRTRRSVCVLPNLVLPGKPRARANAQVLISCSTFSNAGYNLYILIISISMVYYAKCPTEKWRASVHSF